MKNFKDWFSCQVSKPLLSTRTFNFFDEEPPNGGANVEGTNASNASGTSVASAAANNDHQLTEPPGPGHTAPNSSHHDANMVQSKTTAPLTKVEALQVNFLRLVQRIGQSTNNLVVAQVLYRLHLVNLIQAGESGVEQQGLKIDQSRAVAAQLEAAGQSDLNFSFKILVLGRTGVGKSATINSIFDQAKAVTDAFQPATDQIQEIAGTIMGIKITIIDTPGLSPSSSNQRRNRKTLLKVRRFIRKSPPDIVLYFERLDTISRGYNGFPLLKLITEVFGNSVWFNTILVMTHASSPPPEVLDGHLMSYETYIGHCKNVVLHFIHQAMSSTQLENPIILVDNHPLCKTNPKGQKILPNGQVWISQFLLLCICTKVLAEANSLLKFQDSFQLSVTSHRLPSLPHLLSSFLRPRFLATFGELHDDDLDDFLDYSEEDEYDQLPPIRILTKTQFHKLSKAQKNAYLDELDYRETLYLKKQWKSEVRRRKERMQQNSGKPETDDDYENNASSENVQMPDMTIPLSFDSDYPVYRYRCLLGNEQWLVRPVLDSEGWDHDVGYDGINLEASFDTKRNLQGSIVGQMNKDKTDFSIHSECAAKFMFSKGSSVLAGVDIQTANKDLVCTIHGDANFKNIRWNSTGGRLSLTSFGKMYFAGAKLEDSISIGRRLKLRMNAGCLGGCGQAARGGSLEATIRGNDYPVRDDKLTLATTLLSFDKETVLGASVQSDFRVGRGTKFSLNANLNSRKLGQICLKTSTSEHVEIALIAVVSLFQALVRRGANHAVVSE